MTFVNTIYVSKNDPDSIADMIKHLNNWDNYYHNGKERNFLPEIICKDCDFPYTANPISVGMRVPIAVKCFRCGHVYFHSDNHAPQ